MLPIGRALLGTSVVLSPQTGLIGSPEKGTKNTIKMRSLIIPDLVPGRQVILKSRHMSGNFRVERAEFKGDTASNDWYVDLTCREADFRTEPGRRPLAPERYFDFEADLGHPGAL